MTSKTWMIAGGVAVIGIAGYYLFVAKPKQNQSLLNTVLGDATKFAGIFGAASKASGTGTSSSPAPGDLSGNASPTMDTGTDSSWSDGTDGSTSFDAET